MYAPNPPGGNLAREAGDEDELRAERVHERAEERERHGARLCLFFSFELQSSKFQTYFFQTLRGLFSAGSKPMFASKY